MKVRAEGAIEMGRFVADFVAKLTPEEGVATIVALSGELGAGKTTFAQAVARALGVEETVNSPTFVIEKIYALSNQRWQRLIHIDAYRLRSVDEVRALGWDEIVVEPTNLIIIEWPEIVPGAIPDTAHRISIEIGEGDERSLHISGLRNH